MLAVHNPKRRVERNQCGYQLASEMDEFLTRMREIYDFDRCRSVDGLGPEHLHARQGRSSRARPSTSPSWNDSPTNGAPTRRSAGCSTTFSPTCRQRRRTTTAPCCCARRAHATNAVRIPAGFAAAFAEHMSDSFMAWIEARPANNFRRRPAPSAKDVLSREMSHYLGTSGHVADRFIDLADQGFTVAELRLLFA